MKIEKKIVGYEVLKDEPQPEPAQPEVATMHERLERPSKLHGTTYKIASPMSSHAMYITINDIILNQGTEQEQRRPFEVFIHSKAMEHYQWVVALTRVISAVFRKGGDCTFLAEELRAVFDPNGGYYKPGGVFMPSLVAEIGAVLEEHLIDIGLITKEELTETQKQILEEKRKQFESSDDSASGFPKEAKLCTKCHTKAMIIMDGCETCLNCGNSKCG